MRRRLGFVAFGIALAALAWFLWDTLTQGGRFSAVAVAVALAALMIGCIIQMPKAPPD